MLCVEFPQVQHIDLSELIHVVKAVAIVTSGDFWTYQRVVSHFFDC